LETGAMSHVADLLNIWGVYIRSFESGIGTHDVPLNNTPFGLYRQGPELRGVYVAKPKMVKEACEYWNAQDGEAACDQVILLGNDPLYGGLGGEYTVITASPVNGPQVLNHELGHSLIWEGEEYDGGFAYFGASSDKPSNIKNLKWKEFLTEPHDVVIEDMKVPLLNYPWHDLTDAPINFTFPSSSYTYKFLYPTALVRVSISGIADASHLSFTLNGEELDLSSGFPNTPEWEGSRDRRWIEIHLDPGLPYRENNVIAVQLTEEGANQPEPQGGKMLTSVEVMEYGPKGMFNSDPEYIGAFPTYDYIDGGMHLRPSNENCLMRRVANPTFCPVCASALRKALEERIANKVQQSQQ